MYHSSKKKEKDIPSSGIKHDKKKYTTIKITRKRNFDKVQLQSNVTLVHSNLLRFK